MPNASMMPASILLAPNLSPAAKIIWACHRPAESSAPSTKTLVGRSSLARATVLRALAELTGGGWLTGRSQISGNAVQPHVTMPAELLADTDLDLQAKLLYGMLQLTPGIDKGKGQFTVEGLLPLVGVTRNTVRRAARKLEVMGWLDLTQEKRTSPIEFTLCNPVAERWEAMIARMSRRLEDWQYRGETFMQEYLSLIIASDEYEEKARPGFLINPSSDHKMELDRYYSPTLAFEYHGPQHDGPTVKFPSTVKAREQQARDLMKEAICARQGIELVVLRFPDLTLSKMLQKVTSAMQKLKTPLPLRDLSGDGPVIAYLEELTETHRRAAGIIDVTARRARAW